MTPTGGFKMQKLVPGGIGVRRFISSHSGAAAAEFAIVVPVLILCLFSIITFASTFFLQNNMVNAAREAVRAMAVIDAPFTSGAVQCDQAAAEIVGSAEYIACAYLIFWGTDFTVNARDCFGGEDEAEVEITLDASQAALMDIFGFFDGKTLTAEVSMRKEDRCV